MISNNILFTGLPGCGKTTLVEKIVKKTGKPACGFVTRELREKGRRVGFTINTLDGKQGLLAHRHIKSRYRVGKYGVDIDVMDRIAVPAMIPERPHALVVIDEIGKMECFSPLFKKMLTNLLDSAHPVIGSISLKGDAFIRRIKARGDVVVVQVTEQNREGLIDIYAGAVPRM
ncbi:NTPase [Thermodesulfobacteriota bacterium]